MKEVGKRLKALRGTKDEGRGLIYLPPLSENGQAFCSLPVTKPRPFSCRCKRGAYRTAPRVPRQPRQQV